jgi:predicted ATPase
VAALADRLLAECPEVRVLATSREPLGIMGEALWPVEPLDLPAGDAGLAEALTFPAVRLLVERAVAVRPSFQVTEANVGAVVEICRALDGMPLAIELAAARFRVLGPEAIAARLGDRFRLFTAGSRTALPRHQTLRAVVEWSWELLGERERALWRGLTVFAGGATEQSVEEVCSGDLDVLMALVDKSLIIVSEDGRVRMLETIREYGLERLRADPDEEHRLRRAHAEHFLALADAWAPAMRGAGQITALRMLTSEHDNLHAALRWAAQAGETRLALRLIASLGWYWWLRGHRSEAADTVAAVLAEPGLPEDEITASALILASVTSFGGPRDMDVVHGWLARAYSIVSGLDPDVPLPPLLRLVGPFVKLFESEFEVANAGLTTLFDNSDPWLRGMARYMYGQGLINGGRAEEAEEHFEKALQGFQAVGERWGTTFTLVSLAEVRGWRGEFRQAVALCERAVDLMIELGSQNDIAQVYVQLAGQLWMDGDREGAGRVMDRAADLEYAGAIDAQAHLLFYQCRLARLEGRTAEAAAGLERVYRLVRERLSKPSQFHALVLGERAALAVDTGDLDAARSFLAEAIPLALGTRDSPVIAGMLSCRARLAQAMGEQARAAEHLGQAAAIMGVLDLSHPDVVASAGELRAALGAAFDRHYTGGLNQPREEILADLADLS